MSFKSRHKWLILIVIMVAIAIRGYSYYYPKTKILINNKIFTVLTADTPSRRFRGLSHRKDLGKYDGMLFKFDTSARHIFVMRDMNFALDIIWIKDNKTVDITYNAQPESNKIDIELTKLIPLYPANMALEVPAGFTTNNNVKIGDIISLIED